MAANFQPQMGGPGQMMPQQQQQRPQQQRPPQGGGQNATTQIQQVIFQTVTSQTGALTGWQANVLIQERIGLIFNIIGNLRLASQNQPNSPGLNKMIEIGIKFEKEIFDKSPDKPSYKRQVEDKLQQLLERRNQNQAGLQQTIQQQAQAQAQAQQQQVQQQMIMNQNGMHGQPPRTMGQQPTQQGFQHLQHQMQASPLPGQQPQQMGMGMGNDNLPPNMAQNQQQFQMPMQQPQQPQQANHQPGPQPPLTQQDQAILMELATRLMAQAPNEEKTAIRANLRQRMNPQQLQQYQVQGQDPLILYYRNQALSRLRADRQQRMAQAQAQQQMAMGQQPGNMPNAAPPMQQQRSMQPSPMNAPSQTPTSMGGNADFGGFAGNMEMQQQQGVLAQESGQVVVPASGAQRNPTPQPGMMGLPMGMNDQRAMANSNNRAQQQQAMLNAQQMQQQRVQVAQQQAQSQQQARINAQAKAQIGLTGQPGGMGNGPMPPQQSPLPTLNAPLRTPSQMGHPEPSQMNPSPQFGQPLDPRFAQGNQRQFGQGNGMNVNGLNPAMFAGMNQDQIRGINGLPAEKLNEMMAKWNQNKMMMQAQAGRPGMPMPGGGQMHPGQQMPQQGQFNPQNPGMNGQTQAQNMASAMNPQQQALLQQQINRLRQNPAMQQQANMNPGAVPPEQRMQMQMDMMDFPPTLHNHANMPRGVPPEIKKWGQLKQWAQQNPGLGPEVSEHLKGLQKLHWQQLMRQRVAQQAGQQPGGMPIGMQAGPGNVPMVSAGNAPVAPMVGPNGMQMAGGMPVGPGQVRQPTPQDIQLARQHPSGKMANASDDQIRAFLVRQMMAQKQREQMQQQQQQQQQNQLMQNLQMSNQLNQMPGQPRPGQPQPNPSARMLNQVPPPQVSQPKQQPSGPGPAVSGNNSANANRPRPALNNARNTGPNSSPAQPPNRLKRAGSDDPIEVPNPNAPQNRPPPQQAQDVKGQGQSGQMQKQPSLQGRPTLTPQQVANLDPEARKKYEMNARMAQVARGPMDQATKADLEKLRSIAQEEGLKTQPVDDVPMDQGTKDTVTRMLREIKQPLTNMTKAIPRWYQITHDENRAREFFRLNTRLKKQFVDNNLTQPKETFSITVKEIEHARVILNGMVKDLSDRFPKMKKSDSNQPPAPSTSQLGALGSQPAAAPGVLTAANLKEQQQQLDKMHQRSNSRNSQAPPAPTSPQAPFQFGSAKSPPDGVPAYANQNRLTQASLVLPPKKKQKHGGVSTPAGQGTPGSTASPQVSKAVSPEIKRHPAEMRAQPKRHLCPDPECEGHNVAFENEEALRIHSQNEHRIADPLQFVQQNLASLLGMDAQGQSIKQPAENSGPVAPQMSTSGSKQGQTPNIKAGSTPAAATPMNRQVSMNRQSSAVGARPATPSKTATAKDGTTKPTPGQGNTTTPQISQPQPEISMEDPWANATIDPHELFQTFKAFESGAGGAISDMNVYRSITPNDTPESSKDGVSEPNSDISDGVALDVQIDIFDDNWMPFGPSEVGTSFDISNFDLPKEEDIGISMFDEEQPAINFQWDDMVDQAAFDKPFNFDTSLYSMNAD